MHVTDPHLFADSESSLRGTVTHQTLQAVLDHIRRSSWRADIVAVTGDLIQDDSAEAYQRFRELLGTLDLPVHCVPGNHDVRSLMQEALVGPPWHYCESVHIRNWLITGIDSCKNDSAGGEVCASELARLREVLANTDAEHILVCLHHPPLPVGSRWLDTVGLDNPEELLELISSDGRVRAAIFGHVHQNVDTSHNGVRIIGTPSTCRQFKPGSDEFAVDDHPPAYRRLTLEDNGMIVEQIWWLHP